ncbi:solute carrier family 23 member 3 isoform X1 [Microcaecilia unicolor]|uniref:Solute carrier family 23 member 3 isoform X1 n=1 Tax=Microcaecilia unicolor TaxID=1415580 RepID=A0A6P7YM53_9AMPH|nr:solute carrier family 23 member 3 isoform X1 [Microcaecilia unicolor]
MTGVCCAPLAPRSSCVSSYPVYKQPPWSLTPLFVLQHLLVLASLLCVCHILLLQNLPQENENPNRLLATSLFTCGISTALQTTLGSRLVVVQAPSFQFLIPVVILGRQPLALDKIYRNGVDGPLGYSKLPCNSTGSWNQMIREAAGAVLVSGVLQLLFGVSGLCGMISHHCGPMVLAPLLSIIGFSTYKEAALLCSANWGISLLLIVLMVLLSQNLRSFYLPLWTWKRWKGFTLKMYFPAFRMFSMLLPISCIWIVHGILNHLGIETESKGLTIGWLTAENSTLPSPWIKVPYPGEGGWPLLNVRALSMGTVLAIASSINSLGCYVLCSRVQQAPPIPRHACNRGICMEAVGNLLSGILGSVSGAACSVPNVGAIGLTKAGSRHSVQLCALVCVLLGMSPRLTELLTTIPLAVHGGVLCVTHAVSVGAGISYFQYTNIDSGRNVFIVGFTVFMALLVPRWLNASPNHITTGWCSLDLLFLSLLSAPVFLGGFWSFFLDNTISGTLEERGLLPDQPKWHPPSGESDRQAAMLESALVYELPAALNQCRLCPRTHFPCRVLCPPDDESVGVQETVTLPEEGTNLLLKPSSPVLGLDLTNKTPPQWPAQSEV